jgi:hypothetical protein
VQFFDKIIIIGALIGCVERLHLEARLSDADVELSEEHVAGVLQ